MENILTSTKSACNLMMNGAIESSTSNVHNTFAQSFNDSLTSQNEIYSKMAEKGWYPIEQVEQQKNNEENNRLNEEPVQE
jgi:spore coat protein CotF